MKIALAIIVLAIIGVSVFSFRNYVPSQQKKVMLQNTPSTFHELTYTDIHGSEVSMSAYKGKYVLCVNVASKCGLTPQYEKLEALYKKHQDKLVIIGFPCNQFLGQEPGTETEIESFCQKNYGVTFPLSSKIDVKGKNQHPVYTWLMNKDKNGVSDDSVDWNFHKVLISPDGAWLQAFSARMDPLSGEIEALLK